MRTLHFGPVIVSYHDDVLEPRPWTLAQSEWAAELVNGPMLELGCGAGHIGLAAAALTGSTVVQVDRDEAAIRCATHNASVTGLGERVTQRMGDLDEVIGNDERFAIVIADPPWVRSGDVATFPHDPRSAIDGGADGMDLVEHFVTVGAAHLAPAGAIVLQLGGTDQIDALKAWLAEPGTPAVAVCERRTFGRNGALVLLRHRPPASTAD